MKTKFNGILTLILALSVQLVFAQKTVSGTVSDETGPLPGVNVLVEGTTTGTETDFDGKYSISVSEGQTLVFSYVGYDPVSKVIEASNVVDVMMTGSNVLDEVVITAFGIEREKKSVTYVTEKVKSEELTQAQAVTVSSGLVGKVAGLNINIENNGVNPSVNVNLRGFRSITQNNSALVVIDGVQSTLGALADLNPNDVEDLSVLKGATAAALYGADAANGAVIVTTKKGNNDGRFEISLNSTAVLESVAYMPEFQTEYGSGWQGAYDPIENTNWGPRFDGTLRPIGPELSDGSQQYVEYAPVQDNLKDFFNNGFTFQNTLSFSGGNKESSYFLSIGDQRTSGITPDDSYNRNTFRVNASKQIGKLNLGLNSSYFADDQDIAGNVAGVQNRALYWYILNTPANIPLSSYSDWENDKWSKPENYYNAYYENPYWMIDNHRDQEITNRINGNITASWDLFEWMNLTTKLGINKTSGSGQVYHAASDFSGVTYTRPSAAASYVTESEYNSTISNGNSILSFDFDVNDKINIRPFIGGDFYNWKYRSSDITANNLTIPGFYDISNGTGELDGTINESDTRRLGLFADLTVSYNDYLFLNLTGRNDWTSTLPKGNNSYFYPSVGLSFVLTDAVPSLKENSFLDYAKLTVSNSTVYNDVSAYRINERYVQSGSFPFGSINGFALSGTTVSADFKPEKIVTNEFGLNLAFLKNKVTLDAAYFFGNTTDLIIQATTPPSSGASSILTNLGKLKSDGVELTLGAKPVSTKDFKWNFNLNYSTYKTVVDELASGLDEVVVQNSFGVYGVYAIVGEQFPMMKAVAYERDPEGRVIIDPASGNPIVGGLENMGSTTPDYTIGLTNSFDFKGIKLSATLDYRTGHVYYSQLADRMEFTGRSMESVSSNREDFIFPNSVYETSPGVYAENTNIQTTGGNQNFWTNTYNTIKENYVRDATALKIREVSLGYELPKRLLESTFLDNVSVSVISKNLLTFLPAENRFSDPEFNGTDNSVNSSQSTNSYGISGYYQSPPTRTFGLNVNLKF